MLDLKTAAVLAGLCLLTAGGAHEARAAAARADGPSLFRARCAACHSIACNRNGPRLEGVIGKPAGSVADYRHYSAELKASRVVWTEKTIDDYIADPGRVIPGTSMTAAGRVDSAAQRRAIVAHVVRQDRSGDLCL